MDADDHERNLAQGVRLAQLCIEGRLTPLQTARELLAYIDVDHPVWHALDGPYGPLAQLYAAQDLGDRVHWLGDQVERWHPEVRETRRRELAEAEAEATPGMLEACRALIAYSMNR